jgi:hypothetical protein
MAENKQNVIVIETIPKAIEQRVAVGSSFNGAVPALASVEFIPYGSDVDGVIRMKHPNTGVAEGDEGGLFVFDHKQPIAIEAVFADLGASMTWAVALVTALGELELLTGTDQYIKNYGHDKAFIVMPGEKVKVTGDTAAAGWVRVYAKLAQTL